MKINKIEQEIRKTQKRINIIISEWQQLERKKAMLIDKLDNIEVPIDEE